MTMTELMEETVRETFVVNSDQKALWAIKKIIEIEKERDQFIEFYKEQIEKIKRDTQFRIDSMKAKLEDYAITVPLRDTKTQRIYDLPGAKLAFKKPKADFKHDDKTIIAALKAKGDMEFIKVITEERLDWNGLRKRIESDGEIVDGVSIEIAPETFIVELKKGGED